MHNHSVLLIVEDSPSLSRSYEAHLADMFGQIISTPDGEQALDAMEKHDPDCVLLDLHLPDMSGTDLFCIWKQRGIDVPVIVITADGSLNVAVEAMRMGAVDFLAKPVARERLRFAVENAMDAFTVKTTVATLRPKLERTHFCQFVGKSPEMQAVYETIECVASSNASVFVSGETGTGKELAARAIHAKSKRHDNRFVAINCGAIPRELIESELFGHVKGAFTGALADRIGAAQLAEGGTLFLDELTEMPIEIQPKLLRFLQTGEFSRVGDPTLRKADIRIIAATNRDPLSAVKDGTLREDLYYRLHVVPVALPALRARGGDVLLLADEFLDRFAQDETKVFEGFDQSAQEWLVDHAWPGNVRELENLIRQVVVMNPGGLVKRNMLVRSGSPLQSHSQSVVYVNDNTQDIMSFPDVHPKPGGIEPLWLVEKRAIERAIVLCDGNITDAARRLQLSPSTIYRKKAAWEGRQQN